MCGRLEQVGAVLLDIWLRMKPLMPHAAKACWPVILNPVNRLAALVMMCSEQMFAWPMPLSRIMGMAPRMFADDSHMLSRIISVMIALRTIGIFLVDEAHCTKKGVARRMRFKRRPPDISRAVARRHHDGRLAQHRLKKGVTGLRVLEHSTLTPGIGLVTVTWCRCNSTCTPVRCI